MCLAAVPLAAQAQIAVVFRDGVSPAQSYAGTRDVMLHDLRFAPDANYDGRDLEVDGSPLVKNVLMRFDVSAVPAGTPLTSVELIIRVTDNSVDLAPAYECLRPWNQAEATAHLATATTAWARLGGTEPGVDRGTEVLAHFSGSIGTRTIRFTDAGVAAAQRWVDAPPTNFGFLVQGEGQPNGIDWAHCEHPTSGDRPRLRLTWRDGGSTVLQNGPSYSGCSDTMLFSTPPRGGNANGYGLGVGDLQTGPMVSLISFDVSAIPAWSTLTHVALLIEVLDSTSETHPIYEALRPWTETGATWSTFDGVSPWAQPGAGGAGDHGTAVLGFAAGSTGPRTWALNDAGVAVVQAWVDGRRPNQGFVIRNPTSQSDLGFLDREQPNPAQRPGLLVLYHPPDGGPVQLVPQTADVPACTSLQFAADGGLSPYRFELLDAPSGGAIETSGGAYRAGGKAGVSDVVSVTDALGRQASAVVTVLPAPESLLPELKSAPPPASCGDPWSFEPDIRGEGPIALALLDEVPDGLSHEGNRLRWSPTAAQVGKHLLRLRLTGHCGTRTQDVHVDVSCDAKAYWAGCACSSGAGAMLAALALVLRRAARRR